MLVIGLVSTAELTSLYNELGQLTTQLQIPEQSDLERCFTGTGNEWEWAKLGMEAIGEMGTLVDQLYQNQIDKIDELIAKREEYYDKAIAWAEGDKQKTEALEYDKMKVY